MSWWDLAACRDLPNADVMFPTTAEGEVIAKRVCDACLPTVRLACREFSLDRRERHGVWGGLTESERDEELGRRRGRRSMRVAR